MIKRSSILAVVAALMAVSCSEDHILDRQHDAPIAFRTVMDMPTKATLYTAANLTSFNVTALRGAAVYMDQTDFYTTDYAVWSSARKYYWPLSGNLDFYAYAPKAESGNGITFNDYKTLTVAPLADTDAQTDLLFAYSTGSRDADGDVGKMLNFRHTMSKVQVKVSNSNPNLRITVNGWRLAGLDGEATFTYSGGSTDGAGTLDRALWSGNTDAATNGVAYTKLLDNAALLEGATVGAQSRVLEGSAIVIPQETSQGMSYAGAQAGSPLKGSYIAVNMSIENLADGSPYVEDTWCCWPVSFDLQPGFRYVYSIDLAQGGYYETAPAANADAAPVLKDLIITFASVSVDSWATAP